MKELATAYCWVGLACVVVAVALKVAQSTVGFEAPWELVPTSFLRLAIPVALLAIASGLCCEKK